MLLDLVEIARTVWALVREGLVLNESRNGAR
jgi:hypothetical protein